MKAVALGMTVSIIVEARRRQEDEQDEAAARRRLFARAEDPPDDDEPEDLPELPEDFRADSQGYRSALERSKVTATKYG